MQNAPENSTTPAPTPSASETETTSAPPRRHFLSSHRYLAIEFFVLFGGLPLLILLLRERGLMLGLLWACALLTFIYVRKHDEWHKRARPLFSNLRPILVRFALLAPIIAAMTWLLLPSQFLSLPSERPLLWVQVMILYPILSVWPQEIIYRAFVYTRYAPIFGTGRGFITASALAFGFMHIIFLNPVAVAMTIAGGYLFARTYTQHKSIGLVCVEHALYGCLIFTVGLGAFFYTGAAWGTHP